MTPRRRVTLLAIAAVIAILTAILATPTGTGRDQGDRRSARTSRTVGPDAQTGSAPRAHAPRTQSRREPVLRPGRFQTLRVRKGDMVRFAVRSTGTDEVHIHGYDILKEVAAAKTVRIRFLARFEGVFEIELEGSATRIGRLEVRP